MTKRTTEQAYQPRKGIPLVKQKTQHDDGKEYARMITSPEVAAYRVVGAIQPQSLAEQIDVPGLLTTLSDHARAVSGGDLSRPEAMLMSQADSLQSLFVGLVERSLRQENHVHAEGYMRLALKAQSQCRTTLETLVNIKNPPLVYAHQTNITTGPQQVNNSVGPVGVEKTDIRPIQLSGVTNALPSNRRA